MKKVLSKSKQINDLMDLVYLADINFLVCKKLYQCVDPKKRQFYDDFFLLTANNAFYESIGITYSLLCSKKDEEIRIEPLLKEIIEKEKRNELKADYQTSQILGKSLKN